MLAGPEVLDPLELKLQMVISYLTGMLELNSGPLKVLLTVESPFRPSQVSFEEQKFIILKFSFLCVCCICMCTCSCLCMCMTRGQCELSSTAR